MAVKKTKSVKAARPTPRMRALFREVARDIVARDREARKRGLTQNTIGEIERAMVKAYVCGQEALLDDRLSLRRPPDAPIDWLEIPPRARETLSMMTICYSQHWPTATRDTAKANQENPAEIEMFTDGGRKRWAIVRGEQRTDRSMADGSVGPLIRLGLLAATPERDDRYALTPEGIAAGQDYWRRVKAGDPSLPREGMR
jgi:hypothetical protein